MSLFEQKVQEQEMKKGIDFISKMLETNTHCFGAIDTPTGVNVCRYSLQNKQIVCEKLSLTKTDVSPRRRKLFDWTKAEKTNFQNGHIYLCKNYSSTEKGILNLTKNYL